MGADIYLQPKYRVNEAKFSKPFNDAVAERNSYPEGSLEHERIQNEKVEPAYRAMYNDNPYYFRDSYNSSSIMWLMELSWWNDSIKEVNENGDLEGDAIQHFLDLIKSRETVFRTNLENKVVAGSDYCDDDESVAKARLYFENKYNKLIAFLQRAIDENQLVQMSV